MSVEITTRVWKHSSQIADSLLLMLALADFADDDGFCWPNQNTLAKKTRVSVRHVRRLLDKLEAEGEIRRKKGIGRGHNSEYQVLTGMSAEQKEDSGSAFNSTLKRGHLKQEKRTSETLRKVPKTRPATAKTGKKDEGIRQEPSIKDSVKPSRPHTIYGDLFVLVRRWVFNDANTPGINDLTGKITKALASDIPSLTPDVFEVWCREWALKGIDFPSGTKSLPKAVATWLAKRTPSHLNPQNDPANRI